MKRASWIMLIYGILILVGGFIGHLHAESTASLITGAVFGALIIICAFGIRKDLLFPSYASLMMCFFLGAFFLYRFLLTFSFMPAGLMCLLSIGAFGSTLYFVAQHLRRR